MFFRGLQTLTELREKYRTPAECYVYRKRYTHPPALQRSAMCPERICHISKKNTENCPKLSIIEQHGDIPEVGIVVKGETKLWFGGFGFPGDEDEYIAFLEAKHVLWPADVKL